MTTLVDKCQEGFLDQNIIDQCEYSSTNSSGSRLIPVADISQGGLSYRNRQCALCNNVLEDDIMVCTFDFPN